MPSVQIIKWSIPTRAAYPVTLAEAKAYLRVDTTDDNTLITGLITAATAHVEGHTSRVYTEEDVVGYLDEYPDGDIILPFPIIDKDVTIAVRVSGVYVVAGDIADSVDAQASPGRINYPATGWPTTYTHDVVPNAVKVEFTTKVEMLELARSAIMAIVAHWYEYREAFVVEGVADTSKMPSGLDRVLTLLSLPRVG